MTLSAKGTRLNRRGRETREQLLRVAVRCLARGPEAVSANLVAREAGVTWGTVQHQFGDVDGLWAAVLEYLATQGGPATDVPATAEVGDRVDAVIDMVWHAMDTPGQRALYHLRLALPRSREDLEAGFPRTAEAIALWEHEWRAMCEGAFDGLGLDPVRISRVTSLLPGAMRGLHNEQHLSSYTDMDEAKRGLAEALTAYLTG